MATDSVNTGWYGHNALKTLYGWSADTMPTIDVLNGSLFVDVYKKRYYVYDADAMTWKLAI